MVNMMQGELVTLPGLPPFYDYEWYPQPEEVSTILSLTISGLQKFMLHIPSLLRASRQPHPSSLKLGASKYRLVFIELTTNASNVLIDLQV